MVMAFESIVTVWVQPAVTEFDLLLSYMRVARSILHTRCLIKFLSEHLSFTEKLMPENLSPQEKLNFSVLEF
ncbi:hypothetical protein Bca4012_016177 [Brassica carinata]